MTMTDTSNNKDSNNDNIIVPDVVRGFIIRCQDGDLSVTRSQAEQMVKHCEYFGNVFRHGTTEAQRHVLTKPDWTRDVAKSVLELLCRGDTILETGSGPCQAFFQAVDQLQLPVSFGYRFCTNNEHLIATLAHANEIGWMECRLDMMKWQALVEQGILVWVQGDPKHNKCPLVCFREAPSSDDFACDYMPFDNKKRIFKVFSKYDMTETIATMFTVFAGPHTTTETKNQASLSIKFKNRNKVKDVVSNKRLKESDVLFSTDAGSAIVRFQGSFQALYEQVCLFQEGIVDSVGLFCKHPDRATLDQLLASSHYCVDSQGTVGVDVEECAVYLKKTPRDIKRVLEHVLGKYDLQVVFGSANQQESTF